jgi:DNA-binding beta-propeller fold protein YncE
VQVFDAAGRFLRLWWTPEGTLGNPRGLDVGPDGRVYVADTHNNQVLVYSPDGLLERRWGSLGTGPGQFVCVTDVAVDPDGNVWTCEYGDYNDRVQKFTGEGRFLLSVGTFGRAPGEFSRPQGLAAHPDGRIFVADAVNHRVQILDSAGGLAGIVGEVGTGPGRLQFPYDVALDGRGRLYVAEFGNSRISVFAPASSSSAPAAGFRYLTAFGRPGRAPGEFDHPWGVNVDRKGRIYVADTLNYRIQLFPALP